MPVISVFRGIKIMMYYNDHMPPHFHAEYAEHRCVVDILNGCVIEGSLPSRQLKIVLAWAVIRQDELMQNWELSKAQSKMVQIDPI
ncbi:MAG: DUF4160 domain-containing protein [Spirochaetales bacterium]|nr:DUF4160 domain-containing protein [Spirochaetales bacterium]MBQ9810253.1 DUF4160 domain-containing protein [Spirochaetales bacterium]